LNEDRRTKILRILLSFSMMICRHRVLITACVFCWAESTKQPLNARPSFHGVETAEVNWPNLEFPEPHPPTDVAGVEFQPTPIVASAASTSAGFLAEGDDWVVMHLLRPASPPMRAIIPENFSSEELPVSVVECSSSTRPQPSHRSEF